MNRIRPVRWLLAVLAAVLAAVAVAVQAQTVRIGGTGSAMGTMKAAIAAYQKAHPGAEFTLVPGLGSGGGIQAVVGGALDIALSGRSVKPADKAENLTQIELARTPLVFASAKAHPGFRLDQVVQIYAGTVEAWPDGARLRLVLRPESDSETALLRGISPDLDRALTAAQARKGLQVAITDTDMADALEQVPGSFGSSTLALIVSEQRRLKPLRLDNAEPSVKALASGAYRHYKPLYLITAATVSPTARDFIAFLKSKSGAKLMSANGYLPLE